MSKTSAEEEDLFLMEEEETKVPTVGTPEELKELVDSLPGHRHRTVLVETKRVWYAYNIVLKVLKFLAKLAITLIAFNMTIDDLRNNDNYLSIWGGLSLTVLLALWL